MPGFWQLYTPFQPRYNIHMVCIAAFIILILIGVVIAFLSIFNRNLGKKYLKVLKKSWHCFSRRITFRKCDTKFSDDVKNILLKKVVIKKPKLVKPISITIEIASIAIVVLTAWSLIEAVKAGLALWVFGTCNVSQPANCALGAESCAIDEADLNWFTEWGEIVKNIPDRLKTWKAEDYLVDDVKPLLEKSNKDAELALDIIDPGCSVCQRSYKNQIEDEKFLKNHAVSLMLYPIKLDDGSYKFKNSKTLTHYFYALNRMEDDQLGVSGLELKLIDRLFTEQDKNGINFQTVFNNDLEEKEAEKLIQDWLKEWGLDDKKVKKVQEKAHSKEIEELIEEIAKIVEEKVKPKGIPTMIYDGKKHLGLYKKK